jgi:hypothetical protein
MAFDLSKLGVKQNVPKVQFQEYSGLFQAESKFGKTQFAALMPKSILVAFEKGYEAQVINYIDCTEHDTGWDKFIEFIDSLEENREAIGNEIKLIIIDTAEESYRSVEPYTIRKARIDDGVSTYKKLGDIPYGAGYSLKDDHFRKQIKRIYELGFRPLYLTHVELKTVRPKDKNKEPYDIYVPTIPERCAKIIYPEVSYIMHGKRDVVDGKKVRVLQVQGNDETVAGNRVYFDEDIIFDSEEEAIVKFEAKFKEMVKQRLVKAGIKDDVDELAVKQEKEKEAEVKSSLEKMRELPTTIKGIKTIMKQGLKDKKLDNNSILSALGKYELKSPDDIPDVETAKKILNDFEKLVKAN